MFVSTEVVALRAKVWHLAEHFVALYNPTLPPCKSMKSIRKKQFFKKTAACFKLNLLVVYKHEFNG
jgi:hypothetical protein